MSLEFPEASGHKGFEGASRLGLFRFGEQPMFDGHDGPSDGGAAGTHSGSEGLPPTLLTSAIRRALLTAK